MKTGETFEQFLVSRQDATWRTEDTERVLRHIAEVEQAWDKLAQMRACTQVAR